MLYAFAVEKALVESGFAFRGFEDVDAGITRWPMSEARISGEKLDRLVEPAERILTAWHNYADESAFIFVETDGEPHNTITPIAGRRSERY